MPMRIVHRFSWLLVVVVVGAASAVLAGEPQEGLEALSDWRDVRAGRGGELPPIVLREGDFADIRRFVRKKYSVEVDDKILMESAVREIRNLLEAAGLPVALLHALPRNECLPESVAATCTPRLRAEWVRLAAAQGYLKGLGDDRTLIRPHTAITGEFGVSSDIGLLIGTEASTGRLVILEATSRGPAARAGLRAWDVIVSVDGHSTRHVTVKEATRQLEGVPGTTVHLEVERRDEWVRRSYILTRVQPPSISAIGRMLDTETGYIRIPLLVDDTPGNLAKELATLLSSGMRRLVLDLRNSGGWAEGAAGVCSVFLGPGRTVAHAVEFDRTRTCQTEASRVCSVPMIVLVNQDTVLGAEICAACLRDNLGTRLVGTRTRGIDSRQDILILGSRAVVVMSTTFFLTPSGLRFHGKGLLPDVDVPMPAHLQQGTPGDIQLQKARESF